MKKKATPPDIQPALSKQTYHRPTFEVIDLNIQSPLLAGSGTPTSKKLPIVNPINKGQDW